MRIQETEHSGPPTEAVHWMSVLHGLREEEASQPEETVSRLRLSSAAVKAPCPEEQ